MWAGVVTLTAGATTAADRAEQAEQAQVEKREILLDEETWQGSIQQAADDREDKAETAPGFKDKVRPRLRPPEPKFHGTHQPL